MNDTPIGMWLRQRTPLTEPYPCTCYRQCSPTWCQCSGRVDLHNVPPTCCARNGNTPAAAARANHLYAPAGRSACWCKGDIKRHENIELMPVEVVGALTDPDEEE